MSRPKTIALGVAIWFVSAGGTGAAVATFMASEFADRGGPSASDGRLLSGHSLGGLFVGYAVDTRPDLFDAAFAFSPSYWGADGTEADRMIGLAASGRTDATVYLSIGDEDGPMRTPFDRVAAAAADAPGWTATVVPGASHGATPRLSTATALWAHYGR